jgi:hypothetical protein
MVMVMVIVTVTVTRQRLGTDAARDPFPVDNSDIFPVLAEGPKAFKWLALQKAFSEAFKVLNKILKG